MKPLVVIDADVLGRRRTGDETYFAALLRELVPLADQERLAAVARSPDLVPEGIEPLELPARSQSVRMAFGLPRLLRRLKPALTHFAYVVPPTYRGRSVVTIQDLSFERDARADGAARPPPLPHVRPALGSSRRSCAGRLGAHEERPRGALRDPRGEGRRHAIRVDALFHPNGRAPDRPPYALFVGAIQPRKDPLAAIEALALLDGDLSLVVVGAEKRGGDEVRADDEPARARAAGRPHRARPARGACGALPRRRVPRLPVALRGLRPAGARGDGLRDAGRRGAAGAIPEVAGDAAVLVEPGDRRRSRTGSSGRSPSASGSSRPGSSAPRQFSWAETARRTLAVYRELL